MEAHVDQSDADRLKVVWKDLHRRAVVEIDEIQFVEPLQRRDDEDAPAGAMDVSDRLADGEAEQLTAPHGARPCRRRRSSPR